MLDFPNPPLTTGQTFAAGGVTWTWDGAKWTATAGVGKVGNKTTISDTPPAGPQVGDFWFDSGASGVQLYVWYDDGNTQQWVVANNMGGNFLPLTGGTMTGALVLNADPTVALGAATKEYSDLKLPLAGGTLTGPLTPSGGIVGVTNGSNAAAGQVGEFLTQYQNAGIAGGNAGIGNLASLSLTAGDWDVWGTIEFTCSGQFIQNVLAWVNTVSGTVPGLGVNGKAVISGLTAASSVVLGLAPLRLNITATTTVYLTGQPYFSSGTLTMYGTISARRCR